MLPTVSKNTLEMHADTSLGQLLTGPLNESRTAGTDRDGERDGDDCSQAELSEQYSLTS